MGSWDLRMWGLGGVPKYEALGPQNLGCFGGGDPKTGGRWDPKKWGGWGGEPPQLRCWDPKSGGDGGGTPNLRCWDSIMWGLGEGS